MNIELKEVSSLCPLISSLVLTSKYGAVPAAVIVKKAV